MAFSCKVFFYQVILTIFCEVSFFYLINRDASSFLPMVPDPKLSRLQDNELVQYIKSRCPHFGDPKLYTKPLVKQAEICFREKRLFGERSLGFDPNEASEKRLCHELLRHCRDKYDMKVCPSGTKESRIRHLEKCFFDFIPVKQFIAAQLEKVQKQWVHKSAVGVAVFIYGCEPNPFLYEIWSKHGERGIPFVILCRRGSYDKQPAVEVVNFLGSIFAYGSTSREESDRQQKMETAERLEAALEMISDHNSVALTRAITALTTVPVLTFFWIAGFPTLKWIRVLLLLLPFAGPMYTYVLRGNANMFWRMCIVWPFPMDSLIRLQSSPFTYFSLYFIYTVALRLVVGLFVNLEHPRDLSAFDVLMDIFNGERRGVCIMFPNTRTDTSNRPNPEPSGPINSESSSPFTAEQMGNFAKRNRRRKKN